jgi:hypothetical protein
MTMVNGNMVFMMVKRGFGKSPLNVMVNVGGFGWLLLSLIMKVLTLMIIIIKKTIVL